MEPDQGEGVHTANGPGNHPRTLVNLNRNKGEPCRRTPGQMELDKESQEKEDEAKAGADQDKPPDKAKASHQEQTKT